MPKQNKVVKRWMLGVLVAGAVLAGCGGSDDSPTGHEVLTTGSCVGCHMDQVALKALAVEPQEGNTDAGEG